MLVDAGREIRIRKEKLALKEGKGSRALKGDGKIEMGILYFLIF